MVASPYVLRVIGPPIRFLSCFALLAQVSACDPDSRQDPDRDASRKAEFPGNGSPDAPPADDDANDTPPPPVLQQLDVALLSDTEAVALYQFVSRPPKTEISVSFGAGEYTLNDNGKGYDATADDGIYSGRVPFDLDAYEQRRAGFLTRVEALEDPRVMSFSGQLAQSQASFTSKMLPEFSKTWLPSVGTLPSLTVFPSLVVGPPATVSGLPPTVDPYASLVVTDPDVVRDPAMTGVWANVSGSCQQIGNPSGPWGIVGLMDGIANGHVTTHDLMIDWITSYASARTVNGETIGASLVGLSELTDGPSGLPGAVPWPKFVDDGSRWTFNDVFDLSGMPVQLIAIVNRPDLAMTGGYAGDTDTNPRAELRFVFTFIEEETCRPSPGGFILEYEVPLDSCDALQPYFQDWHALSSMVVGSAGYNAALHAITDPVTAAGAGPSRPNDSNLRVLRTNEQNLRWPHYLNDFPTSSASSWDMQEFAINAGSHQFENQTLSQTPHFGYELPDWAVGAPYPQPVDTYIQNEMADILSGTHVVPLLDPSTNDPLRAAVVRYGNFHWTSTSAPPYQYADFPPAATSMTRMLSFASEDVGLGALEARTRFSLNTCNGCHYSETFEDGEDGSVSPFSALNPGASTPGGTLERPFRHIRPNDNLAAAAHLSRFMTGTNATCSVGAEFVAPLGPLSQCGQASCCPIGDPVFGYTEGQVHFNELHRRGSMLEDVVVNGCAALSGHQFTDVIVSSAH